ncbi:hypothetical protein Efla_007067 [Eimeria flavescens]
METAPNVTLQHVKEVCLGAVHLTSRSCKRAFGKAYGAYANWSPVLLSNDVVLRHVRSETLAALHTHVCWPIEDSAPSLGAAAEWRFGRPTRMWHLSLVGTVWFSERRRLQAGGIGSSALISKALGFFFIKIFLVEDDVHVNYRGPCKTMFVVHIAWLHQSSAACAEVYVYDGIAGEIFPKLMGILLTERTFPRRGDIERRCWRSCVMVTATIECRDAWRCATDEWPYAGFGQIVCEPERHKHRLNSQRLHVRRGMLLEAWATSGVSQSFRTQAIASRRHRCAVYQTRICPETDELRQGHALAQKALIVATKRACFCRKVTETAPQVTLQHVNEVGPTCGLCFGGAHLALPGEILPKLMGILLTERTFPRRGDIERRCWRSCVMVTATIECRDAWRCATDEWTYARGAAAE